MFQVLVSLSYSSTNDRIYHALFAGLVFVLITVRAQTAKTQPTSTLPGWLDASSNSRNYLDEETSSPDNGVTSTVNAVKLEEGDKSETSSESSESAKGRRERHEKDSI